MTLGRVRRGEPRWGKGSPLPFKGQESLESFVVSFASNWNHFVFAAAWFHEHSVFYSCHLPKYTLIDFNLHSISSGYLEHLQSQDI